MERFARHALIPGWSQDALAGARVVLIGVGALGNEVARLLAMAGVGELLLCDPDTVAESDLSRSVLFRAADIGRSKVETARAALAGLAPGVRVLTRDAPLDAGVGLAELRDADLVAGCLDSNAARVQLASRCGMAGVGLLDGGTRPWGGEVRRFVPDGACYGCVVGAAGRATPDDPVSCGAVSNPAEHGASAPVSALVGSWMATIAVRILCGLPPGPETIIMDADGDGPRPGRLSRAPDCPLHGALPAELIENAKLTTAATAAELLALVHPEEDVMTWRGFGGPDGRTTTFLRRADPGAALRALSVAPREILPVIHRPTGDRRRYVELAAEDREAPGA